MPDSPSPNIPADLIVLVVSLLQHAAKLGFGETATTVVIQWLVKALGDKTTDEIKKWVVPDKIPLAFQEADKQFAEACRKDSDLTDFLTGLQFSGLDSVQKVARDLPKTLDEEALLAVMRQAFQETYPTFSPAKLNKAATTYHSILENALASQADQLLPNLYNKVTRIEEKVDRIEELLQGLRKLPIHYDGLIRDFLQYYLGTPTNRVPFGGRQADYEHLEHWLQDSKASPYLLLAAPAGRGKSALLAHWINSLDLEQEDIELVYFPISLRFNTNREEVVFAALAARLAHLHGVESLGVVSNASEYRILFNDFLRRPLHNGRRLLVVIDGLDEAIGWTVKEDLFPSDPPPHLRVVLAARQLANDPTGQGWLMRLGWESFGKGQIESLEKLDRQGVADVLLSMDAPLDVLAKKLDVVTKLYELSEGEPLVVRLYVEILKPQGTEVATFTAEDLLTLKPGLRAYFDRWFQYQSELWGKQGIPISQDAVDALFSLCAVALGPLSRDDILNLAPDYFASSSQLDRILSGVSRFIIGDGTIENGYTLSHPRLNEYFSEKLTNREWLSWHQRFLDYGTRALKQLESQGSTADVSGYILRNYSSHLDHPRSPSSAQSLYSLLSESWLHARLNLDGTPDGFLTDVRRAWTRAESDENNGLGWQVRSALCFASVNAVSAGISDDLLVKCVQSGVLNIQVALALARQKPNIYDKAKTLANLAQLTDLVDQAKIWEEALRIIVTIEHGIERYDTLAELIKYLPPGKDELLDKVLDIIWTIGDGHERAKALLAVEKYLPPAKKLVICAEALKAARAVDDDESRAFDLIRVIAHLAIEQRITVFDEILSVIRKIETQREKAFTLSYMAQYLSPEVGDLLEQFLSVANMIDDGNWRAVAQVALVEYLPIEEGVALLGKAWKSIQVTDNESDWSMPVMAVAEHITPETIFLADEVLSAVRLIDDDFQRAFTLIELARRLTPEKKNALLDEALRSARSVSAKADQVEVLLFISEYVSEKEISELLLDEALSVARKIGDQSEKAEALSRMSEYLVPGKRDAVLEEALSAARSVGDESERVHALTAMAICLTLDEKDMFLRESLRVARMTGDEYERASSLAHVGEYLPLEDQIVALDEALETAILIDDESIRVITLCWIVDHLPPEATYLFDRALTAARSINDEVERIDILLTIAKYLPDEGMLAAVLDEALTAARNIGNQLPRIDALGKLAKYLTLDNRIKVLEEAFGVVGTIVAKSKRDEAIRLIIKHLPSEASVLLQEVLIASRMIGSEYSRANALRAIAELMLPKEQMVILDEALTVAREVGDRDQRAEVLQAIARGLPSQEKALVLNEALSAARAITENYKRAMSLVTLSEQLPPEEKLVILSEALSAALASRSDYDRAQALSVISERLPPEALSEAYIILVELHSRLIHEDYAGRIIKTMTLHWHQIADFTGQSEIALLTTILHSFARATRPRLLEVIEALLPIIERLGGRPAFLLTGQSILATAQWWP